MEGALGGACGEVNRQKNAEEGFEGVGMHGQRG
jgi:hypothetical protein